MELVPIPRMLTCSVPFGSFRYCINSFPPFNSRFHPTSFVLFSATAIYHHGTHPAHYFRSDCLKVRPKYLSRLTQALPFHGNKTAQPFSQKGHSLPKTKTPALVHCTTSLGSLHLSRLGQKKFYFFLYIFYQTLTDF